MKTLKSTEGSGSGVVVSDNSVRLNAGQDVGINLDERGITFAGPISFVNGINQIRVGGLFTFNNTVSLLLPSTIATPTPVLMIDPPVKQIGSLMKQAALMIALMGGIAATSAVG